MNRLVCPNCTAKLKLPGGFTSATARCPRCGTRVPVESAWHEPPVVAGKPESPSDDDSWVIDTGAADDLPGGPPAARRQPWRWSRAAAMLDLQFRHDLTPRLIRFSWVLVLALGLCWIGFLAFVFVTGFFAADSPNPSAGRNLSGPALDPDSLLAGGDPLAGLGGLLSGGVTPAEPTMIQQVTGFGWSLLFFVTSIGGLMLTLVGCRVMLETLMVIFDIRDTLQRIESRDSDKPAS